MDVVAYTTQNYKLLTDVWLESLQKVPVPNVRIHLTTVGDQDGYKFLDGFYMSVIIRKIKNLVQFDPPPDSEFVVSSDCDIQFFQNEEPWKDLLEFMRKSPRQVFFMRDCKPEYVNGGFYIIKTPYFVTEFKAFLRRMLVHGIEMYMYYEQCYFNEYRHELLWEFIPDEYTPWHERFWRWDFSRACIHHAIGCFDDPMGGYTERDHLYNKLKAMHRIRGLVSVRDDGDSVTRVRTGTGHELVVAKYKENTIWTRHWTSGPVTIINKRLNNIGREAHAYLSFIIERYETLPARVTFSQGWPFDHSHEPKEDLITAWTCNGHIPCHNGHVTYPKERLDVREWFHTYVNSSVNLDEPIKIWWGACFSVTREQIQSRPKEKYE